MTSPPFIHLTVFSDASLGRSVLRVEDLPRRAAELGMEAVALTDEGTLSGSWRFEEACRSANVLPIFGMTLEVAWPEGADLLTLLAENERGWRSLVGLATAIGAADSTRLDPDHLWTHRKGVTALTGGPGSALGRICRLQNPGPARRFLDRYGEFFGHGRFYVKVHSADTGLLQALHSLGLAAQTVAVHEVRALTPEDASKGFRLRRNPSGTEGYLKSSAEMDREFGDHRDLLERTVELAARCAGLRLPRSGGSPSRVGKIRSLGEVLPALRKRLGSRPMPRLEQEVDALEEAGLSESVLFADELVHRAQEAGHRVRLDSMWSGSVLAHSMGLVDVDPQRFDIPFTIPRGTCFETDLPDDPDLAEWLADLIPSARVIAATQRVLTGTRSAVVDACRLLGIRPPFEGSLGADALVGRCVWRHRNRCVVAALSDRDEFPTWILNGRIALQLDREDCERSGLWWASFRRPEILGRIARVARLAGVKPGSIPWEDAAALEVLRRGAHAGFNLSRGAKAILLELDVRGVADVMAAMALAVEPEGVGTDILDRRRLGLPVSWPSWRFRWRATRAVDILQLAVLKARHPREFLRAWIEEDPIDFTSHREEGRALGLDRDEIERLIKEGQSHGHL